MSSLWLQVDAPPLLTVANWLQVFQKCDLYSKVDEIVDVGKVKEYYAKAIDKYFPKVLKW